MTKSTEPAALNLTPRASSLRSITTFCIKTIHRPQCCAALVRSIHEHYGTNRPTIHVLDDGKPDLRFSSNYPVEAAMIEQIIETEYDIGLSAGRNHLLDAGDTPLVVFADDDHLVTPRTRLPELGDKLNRHSPTRTNLHAIRRCLKKVAFSFQHRYVLDIGIGSFPFQNVGSAGE